MSNWDHIRIEGDGENPTGRAAKIWRNGVLVPGIKHAKLTIAADGLSLLTLTQVVILEKDEDVVERATQALEEREAIFSREEEDEKVRQTLLDQMAALDPVHAPPTGYMPASLILPEIDEPEVPSGGPAD